MTELITNMVTGKIEKENINKMPVAIVWNIASGPSIEFRMGYLWAQYEKTALDDTWPKLENSDLENQRRIQKMEAQKKFRAGNCHLL